MFLFLNSLAVEGNEDDDEVLNSTFSDWGTFDHVKDITIQYSKESDCYFTHRHFIEDWVSKLSSKKILAKQKFNRFLK